MGEQWVLAAVGLFLAYSVQLIIGVRALSAAENRLTRQISESKLDFVTKIADLQVNAELRSTLAAQQHEAQLQALEKNMGETGHALRSKIHEMELWSRDKFVQKREFDQTVAGITRQIENLLERLEAKFSRLEKKLDDIGARG